MAQWSTIDYSSGYSYQPQLQVSSNHDQLRQLDDRHKDMQKLEVSIRQTWVEEDETIEKNPLIQTNIVQLHDIHRELATIVTEQGQIVGKNKLIDFVLIRNLDDQ